jgi:hypothetical protein
VCGTWLRERPYGLCSALLPDVACRSSSHSHRRPPPTQPCLSAPPMLRMHAATTLWARPSCHALVHVVHVLCSRPVASASAWHADACMRVSRKRGMPLHIAAEALVREWNEFMQGHSEEPCSSITEACRSEQQRVRSV